MGQFTPEERNALYALFSIDEHEVREGATNKTSGKITWFCYVRREAIQKRLDELFFGEWELYFLNPANPYTYHKEHVDCAMGLSIRGIRREYNGSQDGGGLNGAKGAATDAFKRVVSMWGIGLYLQSSPVIRTDGYKDSEGKIDWKKKDAMEDYRDTGKPAKHLRIADLLEEHIISLETENATLKERLAKIMAILGNE